MAVPLDLVCLIGLMSLWSSFRVFLYIFLIEENIVFATLGTLSRLETAVVTRLVKFANCASLFAIFLEK